MIGAFTELAPVRSIVAVKAEVAAYHGLTMADMNTRRRKHARVRHIAMWVARKTTGASYPQIARVFDNRDHTTIMYGVSKTQHMIDHDATFRKHVETLWACLGGRCFT